MGYSVYLMKRLVIATIAGALTAFTWGFVSWMLIGWHTFNSFTDTSAVEQIILENAPSHGIYMLPLHENKEDQAAATTKGPFIYAPIRPNKLDEPWTMTKPMLISFTISLLCSLIITICVLRIRATRFISRASIGVTLGVFSAISMALPQWNWFETPSSHLAASILDPIIAYTLAGLVIACIIKPRKAKRIFS